MPDLPSRADLFEIGAQVVREDALRIDPAQIETRGSDVNIMLASEAAMAQECVRQLAKAEGRLLLDGCETDEDLDRLLWDRFQMTRKGASAAFGTVEVSRVSAAAGAGVIALGSLLRTETGIQYKTLASLTFAASDVGPKAVDVQAVEAGKVHQVAHDTITAFVVQPFDPTLTVTNPAPTSGGEDRETTELFRERGRDAFRTARRGVIGAIEFGAKTVPGVVSAKAVEVVDALVVPQRFVDLFIADSNGLASAAQAAAVVVALEEYRAAGIFVRVNTTTPIFVDVELRLRFTANIDTIALSEAVRGAVLAFVNNLGTAQTLYVSDLFSVLARFVSSGLVVESDAIVAPVGDLIPGTGETIRTTLDRVVVE